MRTFVLIGGIFLFVFGTSVFAQDASTTEPIAPTTTAPVVVDPTPTFSSDEIEAQKQRRIFYTPLVKDRTKNLLDNVMNRLESATDRFDRIAARIESRIQKEEASGRDGTVAREALTRARTEIERARREASMITELQMDLVVDSESPRASFQNLSIRIITTQRSLITAKQELSTALAAISGAPIPEPADTATSTEETSTSTADTEEDTEI